MNLYLLSQSENTDWDTYDACIVVAYDAEEAKHILPRKYSKFGESRSSWCSSPDFVRVELIGVAVEGLEKGVVLASFNAG